MNSYTPDNTPMRGVAKKIWQELSAVAGVELLELHYNPNNYGNNKNDGWGTWACHIRIDGDYSEWWCGYDTEHGAYLQKSSLPFTVMFVRKQPTTPA